jgi:hypothetical protein
MKIPSSLNTVLIAAGVVSFGLAAPSQASAIFSTDFESDSVGATTATTPSGVGGFFPDRAGGIIRDSSTIAPFGSNNQYLEFSGLNSRAIVSGASTQDLLGSLFGLSVNFYDAGTATAGFGTRLGLGTGEFASTPDLNGPGSVFSLRFRTSDRTVNADVNTSVVAGTLGSYTLATAYKMNYVFNLTGETQSVQALDGSGLVSLAPLQALFGMQNLTTNSYSNLVTLQSSLGSFNNHLAIVFRNFSGDATIAYYDDLSIAVIPEPSTWALLVGLTMLGVVGVARHRRNRRAA